MGTLGAIGRAWGRYGRRLGLEEAGALWGLVAAAGTSAVPGSVLARAGVLSALWSLGEGDAAEGRALALLERLQRKGAVSVRNWDGNAVLVTVSMFGDGWEKRRERERRRKAEGRRQKDKGGKGRGNVQRSTFNAQRSTRNGKEVVA